jgi:transcriptional regulator with XRE-family HTH domain
VTRTIDRYTGEIPEASFGQRLRLLTHEFGSRYALAKVSGIPSSTLQGYEAGSKPGMDALLILARVGNVDLNWLMTGVGEMRPPGMQPGAVFQDVLMVDQYELGAALTMEMVIGQIPFSRHFLETRLRLKEPTHTTLLAVEAGWKLLSVARGDLVLVDRKQANYARDGIYLLDLPGLELRGIFRRPDQMVDVIGPDPEIIQLGEAPRRRSEQMSPRSLEMSLSDLFGIRYHGRNQIVGRAVWL